MGTRGGKRQGAGRPALEKTVQVRIPLGVLDDVKRLVESYKSGVKLVVIDHDEQTRLVIEANKVVKPDTTEDPDLLIKRRISKARVEIKSLTKSHKNQLMKQYGNLENAARSWASNEGMSL